MVYVYPVPVAVIQMGLCVNGAQMEQFQRTVQPRVHPVLQGILLFMHQPILTSIIKSASRFLRDLI